MIEVDVWVRGSLQAHTYQIRSLPDDPEEWDESDVRTLLSEMLRALEREKNPGGETPPVFMRGFNWIVSPYEKGGVLVHLEMQMGTASAGPIVIDERRLNDLMADVMAPSPPSVVH